MKQTSLLKSICALLQKGWGGSFCSSSSFFFFHVKYVVPSVERASLIAQLVKNPPAIQETPVQFLGGKIRWRRRYRLPTPVLLGFPHGSAGKESTCYVGDLGLIPGLGRSPGEENGYPLQYSGLKNSMGSQNLTQLSDFHFTVLSLFKSTSIESVILSNHLILCCPFLLLPSIYQSTVYHVSL